MRFNTLTATMKTAIFALTLLLLCLGHALGQQQVNLTAAPSTITLPDGATVPMWGYNCGSVVSGSTATCSALKPGLTGWSPVVITVPTGQKLTINLTNNLSFTAGTGANTVPTSLVIVGQLGGGLGTAATSTPSPDHSGLVSNTVTWATVGSAPGFTPPPQGPRVQSFATEVAAGATTALTWSNLRPGTYLIESGTHPSIQGPMGLYGVLVVTTAPTSNAGGVEQSPGTAYAGVSYDAEVPLLFSEIDPVQNGAVQAAVTTPGFSETMVWSGQPGGCGNASSPTYHQCYPPAVNYTPVYYMINGVAFDKTNALTSLFPVTPNQLAPATGNGSILVRMVNAGLRMHVPSIVAAQTGTPGANGFALIAEDGNPLPGIPRVQSEVFMAAGKTYDVMINGPSAGAPALPVFDRELSLSGNAINRDSGMIGYIGVNGSSFAASPAFASAAANADTYNSVVAGQTLTVSDPSKGVLANDVNVFGANVTAAPTKGALTLNTNGTFTYVANSPWSGPDSFTYCGNGTSAGAACATVTLNGAAMEASSGIVLSSNMTFTATTATYIAIKTPGVLTGASDSAGYPLKVSTTSVTASDPGLNVYADVNGGFTATVPSAGTYHFTYQAQNSQGTLSAPATVTLIFPQGSGLAVTVVDSQHKTTVTDYRWIIEEDRTYFIDPNQQTNTGSSPLPTLALNFASSFMPFVAQGCTGPLSCAVGQTVLGSPVVCDVSNGVCRPGTQNTAVDPSQVVLDPTKRYYISILPGDAATPFSAGYGGTPTNCASTAATSTPGSSTTCGHGMGGASIAAGQKAVTVLSTASPYPTGKLSVMVFEDDFPLNGEQDTGGGVDILATNEPGLGGFNIVLWDVAGQFGDVTGQMTYDMFNQPLTNSLAGSIDPATGNDACPISKRDTADPTQAGITGMIVTCPKYESDGTTLSPLAGEAIVNNLMPGLFIVQAIPGADRIARGEEWLQTNTLDGQKPHDAFVKIGEPPYFQEYGPAGFHDVIGFANPAIIQARKAGVCNGTDLNLTGTNCTNSITGKVTSLRLSRPPDERLYSSGSRDAYAWSQCYVSIGDPDGEDFDFAKCDADGNFKFTGIPDGQWRLTLFDQWNDQIVDGLSTPVYVSGGMTNNMGDLPVPQWQANVDTRTFVDDNRDGVWQPNEAGIPLINTTVRYRDGSLSNNLGTDFDGVANFNEVFPLFAWYVVETDTTRYKTTGIHTVYDAGGPTDGSAACTQPGNPTCGSSAIGKFLANTYDPNPLPTNLSVPGAVYCADADCTGASIANGPVAGSPTNHSTGRIDAPWVPAEAWQGYMDQFNFIEFGKTPYAPGENGGIHGHVIYASTRPFDDPQLLVQTQWEPLVPNVTINLYKEGFAADGVTPTLSLIDTTKTSSWDDFVQGFHADPTDPTKKVPNMSCPGQGTSDLFYFSLYNQPSYLDWYGAQHGGNPVTPLPYNAQYKCYDGMHNWNQLQPAPYDGMYSFPSVTGIDPVTGKPTGTNCTGCTTNPDSTDPYRYGQPMLPAGKYVVEVVVPPGYELVKEEDKNILIGDNFIAPVTQEFGGLGNIFIIPDQASVASAYTYNGIGYNANNPQNPTQSLGAGQQNQIVPGFIPEPVWPCVGTARIVPDYISLFPASNQVAPFAGATRNLCDRKEVTLGDQMGAIAKFYVYTSTHIAAHFSGIITDDFTVEFDPFAPTFGEKFSPPNLPVSFRDWTGAETSRVYADQWGAFNGLTFSTWEVNPPNPTGYSPNMMVACMNDRGDGPTPDPMFDPSYSQFCYEWPFMPGRTSFMDTPVFPNTAFATGYDHPDCNYPDATPAVSEVDGDGVGPWASAPGKTITIKALGDKQVTNYGYVGPSGKSAPFNQKTVNRHYGFGAQCTSPSSGSSTCNTLSAVTIGGQPAKVSSWNDSQIVVTAPANVPLCSMQQQAQYGGPNGSTVPAERCGELVVTAGNGKQTIDSVTVTIGGKSPTHVTSSGTIQAAIDAAAPGDLILVDPGVYKEMVIMWKPVRLQGAGAATSLIDANTQPAGKLDPWRRQVNCLFGLAMNGQPYTATNPYDDPNDTANNGGPFTCPGTGWQYANGGPNYPQMVVDRIPLEGILGWDTTVNGNLAEQLQEPSLMGAYEGAGITVLAKGVNIPAGFSGGDLFGSGAEASFPNGTTLLTARDCTSGPHGKNLFPTNFQCNPSRIDGLSVTDSSQGGGGVFLHAWAHNMEIANNRVYSNSGTLAGGITIGQGEFPDAYLNGTSQGSDFPGSCNSGAGLDSTTQLPYCLDLNVTVHNNSVTLNTSVGDELFTGTPAGAGGVSFCTGSDYYKFNYNWICGNMSTGDGGGVSHIGFSYNGDIEHNTIIFNQSLNPTIPTNGGGLIIMGAAPDGVTTGGIECGTVTDADCVPGLSDGTGPGLVINANLIQGNAAESGSGGGIAFQGVNGADIARFPAKPSNWYAATVTNNIIVDNVAGWDGGGISVQDSLAINIINNTIASNDTTASSGVLFNTIGAPVASNQSSPPFTTSSATTSAPQPAGLVAMQNSPQLTSSFTTGAITCPTNHPNCTKFSYPYLANDLFWQNRSFYISVGAYDTNYQQHVVALYNAFSSSLAGNQPQMDATTPNGQGSVITGGTGACVPGATYWDIGVRGDKSISGHESTLKLAPSYSILTDANDYPGLNNLGGNPTFMSQYCNGSRVPPEFGANTYQVPPGIVDATMPNPIFSLQPGATVDEGNNWVNMQWGPLSMTNPTVTGSDGNYGAGVPMGNYAPAAGSPAIDAIPNTSSTYASAPKTDFFGNKRPDIGNLIDIGAVEFQSPAKPLLAVNPASLTFPNTVVNTNSASQTLTLTNEGGATASNINVVVTGPFTRSAGGCGTTLGAGTNCSITIVFHPTTAGPASGSVTITSTNAGQVVNSPVGLSGNGVAAIFTASVSPNPLVFGTWHVGTTTPALQLTVTNTGNSALAGGSFTFGGGTPQPYSRPAGSAGGTCAATLAVGASCTINVRFAAPATAGTYNRTLTVSYTGATVTPNPVSLTGTSTSGRATVAITPSPLTITLPTGTVSGTGTVTFTNTSTTTSTTVTNVTTSGGTIFTYVFNTVAGSDTCTGVTLAPGANCTIGVRFTNTFSPRGANRSGTITFTDDATGSPQSGGLVGFATP